MNRYYIQKQVIHLIFKFNTQIIKDIKAIPNHKYNGVNKEWHIPVTLVNGDKIKELLDKWGFKEDNNAVLNISDTPIFTAEQLEAEKEGIEILKEELPKLGLNITPRPYQWKGIYYQTLWGNCINGSDMGLGKSPMTIFVTELNEWFPCIIVCPSSTTYQWRDLWKIAKPDREVSIIETGKNINWNADVLIVSWGSLAKKEEDVVKPKFPELLRKYKYLVADEIHYAKAGKKSMRGEIFMKMANKAEFVVGLSGTLATNKPSEMIKPLQAVKQFKPLFGDWNYFVNRFCGAFKDSYGRLIYSGASNLLELNRILHRNCYFRINKVDAKGKNEPPQINYLWTELSNKKEYLKAKNSFIDYLVKHKKDSIDAAMNAEILVQRSILKQLTIKGKMKFIFQWIDDFLESSNGKLLVAGMHTEPLKLISEHYRCKLLNGEVNAQKKREIAKGFGASKDRLMCVQVIAVGTGTDGLQHGCSNMLVIELPDTPAQFEQLVSRIDRDGQTELVNITVVLGKESHDEIQKTMVDDKSFVTDAINKGEVDGQQVNKLVRDYYLK